jgi:hypothetical protein
MNTIEKDLRDYIEWCNTYGFEAKQYSVFKFYLDNVYTRMHTQS